MLARKKLIPLKTEFERIRASGKMYDSPLFGLIVSFRKLGAETEEQMAQAACIVSKKVSKSSVSRHSVKRKILEAVKSYLPRLGKNVELTFLAKQAAIGAENEQVSSEVEICLKRAQLL